MHITPDKAEGFLADVPRDMIFRMHMGAELHNIRELAESLDIVSDETFSYHVNNEKNDFANWVHDVIGDTILASEIRHLKTKDAIKDKVRKRISALDHHAAKGRPMYSDELMKFGLRDFIVGVIVGFVLAIIINAFI